MEYLFDSTFIRQSWLAFLKSSVEQINLLPGRGFNSDLSAARKYSRGIFPVPWWTFEFTLLLNSDNFLEKSSKDKNCVPFMKCCSR